MKLRIATNPHLTKDQQDLIEDIKESSAWEEKKQLSSAEAFYKGIAEIEAARSKR